MILASLLALLPGCTGAPEGALDGATDDVGLSAQDELPEALVDASWVVTHASEAAVGTFANDPGWVALVVKRDHAAAVRTLGPAGGLPAARAHAEAAALFRQAALITSYGLVEVYGKTPEPTDPVGAAHLLTVAYAITGQRDLAKASAEKLASVKDDPSLPWHGPWRTWLASDAPWPPDLSALPMSLPEPSPGGWPEVGMLPHYSLPELGGSTASRDMADPSALVALALWHDAAAAASLGAPGSPEVEQGMAMLRSMRAGYQLPVEPPPPPAGSLPPELLFGSDLLVPNDAIFLADLAGPMGSAAIDAHASDSLLAHIAAASRSNAEGQIDVGRAMELLSGLRRALIARSEHAAGRELGHHRTLADIAYVGALRSMALVAERQGDREASGRFRISAYELSEKATACPVGLMALAAWDASNRYPMRAQDILHAQARRYPSIEVARYGLDVLGLRVGSERVGETAGM